MAARLCINYLNRMRKKAKTTCMFCSEALRVHDERDSTDNVYCLRDGKQYMGTHGYAFSLSEAKQHWCDSFGPSRWVDSPGYGDITIPAKGFRGFSGCA